MNYKYIYGTAFLEKYCCFPFSDERMSYARGSQIKHVLSATHSQFTPQHTSTHLSTLQHQVSYDARARLWVREADNSREKGRKKKRKKNAVREIHTTETGPREGREEA